MVVDNTDNHSCLSGVTALSSDVTETRTISIRLLALCYLFLDRYSLVLGDDPVVTLH